MSSCEQSRKASSSTVVRSAEHRDTGLTARLCEVTRTGTVQPQPSELRHDNPCAQREAATAPRRLDFRCSFHYTYIVWHSNARIRRMTFEVVHGDWKWHE